MPINATKDARQVDDRTCFETITTAEGVSTLLISGEITMTTLAELDQAIRDSGASILTVDLFGTTFADISAIDAFLLVVLGAEASGHSVKIWHEDDLVRRAVKLAGLSALLEPLAE
jgi:ABC-type transporter Mla MlaB component